MLLTFMLKKIFIMLSAGLFLSFAFSADPVLDPIGDISFDEHKDKIM